jgi:hypothetical protein
MDTTGSGDDLYSGSDATELNGGGSTFRTVADGLQWHGTSLPGAATHPAGAAAHRPGRPYFLCSAAI